MNRQECFACGFTAVSSDMMLIHKSICEKLGIEQREDYLAAMKAIWFDSAIPKLHELARQQHERQKAERIKS